MEDTLSTLQSAESAAFLLLELLLIEERIPQIGPNNRTVGEIKFRP